MAWAQLRHCDRLHATPCIAGRTDQRL